MCPGDDCALAGSDRSGGPDIYIMTKRKFSEQFRIGLQLKSVIIITFVVLSAMLCGGWMRELQAAV